MTSHTPGYDWRVAVQDIVVWSEKLPDWQRDALRRLSASLQLDSAAEDELYSICRFPHALLDNGSKQPVAQTLAAHHVPAGLGNVGAVTLGAIRQPKNVNALDADQSLILKNKDLRVEDVPRTL